MKIYHYFCILPGDSYFYVDIGQWPYKQNTFQHDSKSIDWRYKVKGLFNVLMISPGGGHALPG